MLLRHSLLFLSKHKELESLLTKNPLSRKAYARLIAGASREEALKTAQQLNKKGFKVTLAYLGEDSPTPDQAAATANEYAELIEDVARKEVKAGVSVKLSNLGLRTNEQHAYRHLKEIVDRAAAVQRFVRVDMEEAELAEKTIAFVRQVAETRKNIGVAIQSCLRRSSKDVDHLIDEQIPIRLCKGAYLESEETAFTDNEEIVLYYMRFIEALMRRGAHPAIATHDPKLIEFAIDIAFIFSKEKSDYEFQMFYGVKRRLQEKLRAGGYNVRIYLPYGENCYSYFMRRIAEYPGNLWFFLKHIKE